MRYDDIKLLKGLYFHHEKAEDQEDTPLFRLCQILEKESGISCKELIEFARRLGTNHGISEMTYYKRPDGTQPPPLPCLRYIAGALSDARNKPLGRMRYMVKRFVHMEFLDDPMVLLAPDDESSEPTDDSPPLGPDPRSQSQ